MSGAIEGLHEGRHLRLVRRGTWEFVQRRHGGEVVAIAALTAAGALLLVEQRRVPVGASVIELPAGLVGDDAGHEGEPLEEAARRELEEETGYAVDRLERGCRGPTSAGLAEEIVTLFVGRGARRVGAGGGVAGEDITVHEVPLAEAQAWLAARQAGGMLVDPKVYAGLWLLGAAPRA